MQESLANSIKFNPNRLRHLEIYCPALSLDPGQEDVPSIFVELVAHSRTPGAIYTVASKLPHLQHLFMGGEAYEYPSIYQTGKSVFASLRSYATATGDVSDMFGSLEKSPSLEVMYYKEPDSKYRSRWPAKAFESAMPQEARPMSREMVDRLSNCPRLHEIKFITWPADVYLPLEEQWAEAQRQPAEEAHVLIRSLKRGDSEVLHVRILCRDGDYICRHGEYDSVKKYDKPTWQHFTDFDGLVVPLTVLEKMRVVEGATEEEWQKRGVEVGHAAWEILLDWKSKQDEVSVSDIADGASGLASDVDEDSGE